MHREQAHAAGRPNEEDSTISTHGVRTRMSHDRLRLKPMEQSQKISLLCKILHSPSDSGGRARRYCSNHTPRRPRATPWLGWYSARELVSGSGMTGDKFCQKTVLSQPQSIRLRKTVCSLESSSFCFEIESSARSWDCSFSSKQATVAKSWAHGRRRFHPVHENPDASRGQSSTWCIAW